jgi:hypothetical protein
MVLFDTFQRLARSATVSRVSTLANLFRDGDVPVKDRAGCDRTVEITEDDQTARAVTALFAPFIRGLPPRRGGLKRHPVTAGGRTTTSVCRTTAR